MFFAKYIGKYSMQNTAGPAFFVGVSVNIKFLFTFHA